MARTDLHRLSARPRALRRRLAVLGLLGLAHCSSMGPFEGPQPNADDHALCYNRATADLDQLHRLAKEACGGAEPRVLNQGMELSACPLLVPERLVFACGPS